MNLWDKNTAEDIEGIRTHAMEEMRKEARSSILQAFTRNSAQANWSALSIMGIDAATMFKKAFKEELERYFPESEPSESKPEPKEEG